jgi:hypothetical protein
MDATAISLCMENRLPIVVFDLFAEGNIKRVLLGEPIGTLVRAGDDRPGGPDDAGRPRPVVPSGAPAAG